MHHNYPNTIFFNVIKLKTFLLLKNIIIQILINLKILIIKS